MRRLGSGHRGALAHLESIDNHGLGNLSDRYRASIHSLADLSAPPKIDRLVQLDLV
jgi:hypothetical protein